MFFRQKLDKEKYEYTLIYGISEKTSTVEKSFRIRNEKIMNLLKFITKLDI